MATTKSYLKGSDNSVFHLSTQHPISIGRDPGCHVIVKCQAVECRHALIEYSACDRCYILRDLNTTCGTFVNHTLVKNSSARLNTGDIIYLGFGAGAAQFLVCINPTEKPKFSSFPTTTSSLNRKGTSSLNASNIGNVTRSGRPSLMPSQNGLNDDCLPCSPSSAARASTGSSARVRDATAERLYMSSGQKAHDVVGGATWWEEWETDKSYQYQDTAVKTPFPDDPQFLNSRLLCLEKDLDVKTTEIKLLRDQIAAGMKPSGMMLKDEVDGLRHEVEKLHRDKSVCSGLVSQMRKDLSVKDLTIRDLVKELENLSCQVAAVGGSSTVTAAGSNAATYGSSGIPTVSVNSVAGQDKMTAVPRQTSSRGPGRNPSDVRRTVADFVDPQMNSMESSFATQEHVIYVTPFDKQQKSKHDAQLNAELHQSQLEASLVQEELGKRTAELSQSKTELSGSHERLGKLSAQLSGSQAELAGVQEQMSKLKAEMQQSRIEVMSTQEKVVFLTSELTKARTETAHAQQRVKPLETEVVELTNRLQEIESAGAASIDNLQKTSNTLSRLRSRLTGTLNLPSTIPSDKLDDEIIELVKKRLNDCRQLTSELNDCKKNLEECEAAQEEIETSGRKLREEIKALISTSMSDGAHICTLLRQQTELVRSSLMPHQLADIKAVMLTIIQSQAEWVREIDAVLDLCGSESRLSAQVPSRQFQEIQTRADEYQRQCSSLVAKVEMEQQEHRRELERSCEQVKRQLEDVHRQQIAAVRNECAAQTKAVVDEALKAEQQKCETKFVDQKATITELENAVTNFIEELQEKEDEIEFYKEQELLHQAEVDSYRKVEAELREQVIAKESSNSESLACIEECLRKKYERDVETYKDQLSRQEATIAAHQERLSKVLKGNRRGSTVAAGSRQSQSVAEPPDRRAAIMAQTVDKLKADVEKLQADRKKMNADLTQCRAALSDKDLKLAELGKLLGASKEQLETCAAEARLSVELTEIGARCRGEQHGEVIGRQGNAIAELRTRIRELEHCQLFSTSNFEQATPGCHGSAISPAVLAGTMVGSTAVMHPQLASSVVPNTGSMARSQHNPNQPGGTGAGNIQNSGFPSRVHSPNPPCGNISNLGIPSRGQGPNPPGGGNIPDLFEMQLANAVSNRPAVPDGGASSGLELPTGIAALDGPPVKDSQADGSKVKEALETLAMSEEAYIDLLKAIVAALRIDVSSAVLRPMSDSCIGEVRASVARLRSDTCSLVRSTLDKMRDDLARQSADIAQSELELRHLRAADSFAEEKSRQVDSLTSDLCCRVDEMLCLRALVAELREKLETEKRLNAVIKDSKGFMESNRIKKIVQSKKHQCYPELPAAPKTVTGRLVCDEKLKRKDYEIVSLKRRLVGNQQELDSAKQRLRQLEKGDGNIEEYKSDGGLRRSLDGCNFDDGSQRSLR